MNLKLRLAAGCYALSAIHFLGIGLGFVFASEFFPFHSDVIQTPWSELDALSQALYLGMMRTEGAGFLASSAALGALLYVPFRRREPWSCWAMSSVGILEHLPTLIANLHVSQTTPGSPPWQSAALGMALLTLGLGFGLSGMRETKPEAPAA